jgi:hypothetical protein
MKSLGLAVLVAHLLACGDHDDDGGEPALFPADYATTYVEVRNCRFSLEHDLVRMRVLASPDALTPYNGRTAPFPTGAIVLKEQYDGGDDTCTGPIFNVTVMQKLDVGSAPETLDWNWQETDAEYRAVDTDIDRCTRCHTDCGKPPEGYDGTCTVP